MAIALGIQDLLNIKLSLVDVLEVRHETELIWPLGPDLDPEELKAVLSCITMGYWQDVLPWNDKTPWIDKV